jgi:hypothetical protein
MIGAILVAFLAFGFCLYIIGSSTTPSESPDSELPEAEPVRADPANPHHDPELAKYRAAFLAARQARDLKNNSQQQESE